MTTRGDRNDVRKDVGAAGGRRPGGADVDWRGSWGRRAVSQLTDGIPSEALDGTGLRQSARVQIPHGNRHHAGIETGDVDGQGTVYAGGISQLTKAVVAPALDAAGRRERTRVIVVRRDADHAGEDGVRVAIRWHQAPAVARHRRIGRAHQVRSVALVEVSRAELTVGVPSPALDAASRGQGARMLLASRDARDVRDRAAVGGRTLKRRKDSALAHLHGFRGCAGRVVPQLRVGVRTPAPESTGRGHSAAMPAACRDAHDVGEGIAGRGRTRGRRTDGTDFGRAIASSVATVPDLTVAVQAPAPGGLQRVHCARVGATGRNCGHARQEVRAAGGDSPRGAHVDRREDLRTTRRPVPQLAEAIVAPALEVARRGQRATEPGPESDRRGTTVSDGRLGTDEREHQHGHQGSRLRLRHDRLLRTPPL